MSQDFILPAVLTEIGNFFFFSEYSIFILKLKGGLSDSISLEYISRMKDLKMHEKALSGAMVEFAILYAIAKKAECF